MFQHFKQKKYPVVFINGAGDADIKTGNQEITWPEFLEQTKNFRASDKKDGLSFIPVKFKPEKEWVRGKSNLIDQKERTYRNSQNISHITMAVLDLDEKGAVEQARRKFKDFEYVVHSTHSLSPETPYKYRMILPLDQPIPSEQWDRTFIHLMSGINGDFSCKNTSRGYYMPSYNPNLVKNGKLVHNEGVFLSQEKVMDLSDIHMDQKCSEALAKIEARADGNTSERYHPSGIKITNNYSGESLSFEGFMKRHNKKIAANFDGGKGNRHNFAMEVINSEIGIFKQNVRLDLMVEFLYRATLENSSSPLSTGNTASELPELIESAMGIMVPPAVLNDSVFIQNANAQIERGVVQGIEAERNGNWSFVPVIYTPKELGNSVISFMARYYFELEAFEKARQQLVDKNEPSLKSAFMKAFNDTVVNPVLHREALGNSNFSPMALGRFLHKVMIEKSIGNDPQQAYLGLIKKMSGYIANLDVDSVKSKGLDHEKVFNQMQTAVLLNPLVESVVKENKAKFKKKAQYNSSSHPSP